MLSDTYKLLLNSLYGKGLNAPSGAGCFLTRRQARRVCTQLSLNAPSGAGCFLTLEVKGERHEYAHVLMHLLVLGAF